MLLRPEWIRARLNGADPENFFQVGERAKLVKIITEITQIPAEIV